MRANIQSIQNSEEARFKSTERSPQNSQLLEGLVGSCSAVRAPTKVVLHYYPKIPFIILSNQRVIVEFVWVGYSVSDRKGVAFGNIQWHLIFD